MSSEVVLGRTWSHGAVKDLALSLHLTLNRSLKKSEYIDLLLDSNSFHVVEHLLVTAGPHCSPLRSVSPIDNRRILDHRVQNTVTDYYLSCFLTLQDSSDCLETIEDESFSLAQNVTPSISDVVAIPCFVYPADEVPGLEDFTSSKEPLSSIMTKELIVPLGVVMSHKLPDRLIGIVTTIGIIRLSASLDGDDVPILTDVPILMASPKLYQELHSPGPCVAPENIFSILSMIRPCGFILCDQGSSTIALVFWNKSKSPSSLLDVIKFKILKSKSESESDEKKLV
jgi:hypothetical protein